MPLSVKHHSGSRLLVHHTLSQDVDPYLPLTEMQGQPRENGQVDLLAKSIFRIMLFGHGQ